jgi:hypothetical protein
MSAEGPETGDMSDRGASPRARFEPPPWEQEAFDALAAKRAEEQAARQALLEAGLGVPGVSVDAWAEEPAAKPAEPGEEGEAAPEGHTGRAAVDRSATDKAAAALLLRLQQEERDEGHASKWVGRIASVVTFVLGAAMLVAGLAMVRTGGSKPVTVIGSGVLSVFGLAFIGMALWVWISTNRSRGR